MTGTISIDALRKEIEEDRKNLAEKEATFEGILRYLAKKDGKTTTSLQVKNEQATHNRPTMLNQPGDNVSRRILRVEVQDVIPLFKGKEFTRSDIETALRQKGVEIDFPSSRITTELVKLEEGGIECVYRGTGRALSRYKVVQA